MNHDREDDSVDEISYSPRHGGRSIEASILNFDLQDELTRLRQQPSYVNRDPSGRTLVKRADLRIVLMTLRTGARMHEHHASGPISIHVIEGSVRVGVPGQSIDLSTGQLLSLESNMPHDVEAIEDSAFLLTIGRTTYDQVSDRHEHGD